MSVQSGESNSLVNRVPDPFGSVLRDLYVPAEVAPQMLM
jgi:hypothetical protein